jgi:hypothetical protein
MMKLLLTSSGINNTSIHDALVDLLGKPIAESNALFIPTATASTPSANSRPFSDEVEWLQFVVTLLY